MIPARAAHGADFKNCCMTSGRYDGAERKDYFQGVRSSVCMRERASGNLARVGQCVSMSMILTSSITLRVARAIRTMSLSTRL